MADTNLHDECGSTLVAAQAPRRRAPARRKTGSEPREVGRHLPLRRRDGGPQRMSRSDTGESDRYPPESPRLPLLVIRRSIHVVPRYDSKEHDTLLNKNRLASGGVRPGPAGEARHDGTSSEDPTIRWRVETTTLFENDLPLRPPFPEGFIEQAGPSSRDPLTRRRWLRLASLAVLLLVAGGFLVAPAAFALDWEKVSDKDGVLVERRAVPGLRVSAIRVTARSPLEPGAVFETIWKQQEHLEFLPFLKQLRILSDTGDERVAYEQLALPFVRDRDYTVRLRKRADPAVDRYEILIESANDAGPPPDRSYVRVTNIRGSWTVGAGPDGKGSIVRYELQSDPGGIIPAWLVDRTQRHAAADLVRAMLRRTQERNGAK